MARDKATVDDVKKVLYAEGIVDPTDYNPLTADQIQWHIDNYATMLVEGENLNQKGMSEGRVKTIEALLAGHSLLASGIDETRQLSSQMASDNSQASYTGEYGPGLRSTSLGQTAIDLDSSGTLRAIANPDTGQFWNVTLTE